MAFASFELPDACGGAGAGAPAATGGEVRIVEGSAGLAGLEADWRALEAADCGGRAFLAFGYALSAAVYHEARGERVVAAVADRAGGAAVILPVAIAPRAGGRIAVAVALGEPVSQYADALVARDAPPRLVDAALRALAARGGFDLFQFRRVREESGLTQALARIAATVDAAADAPFADLDAAPDVAPLLLRVAGSKQKRERARSRRRLAERGALRFEVLRGEAALGPIEDAFRLKSGWLARAGLFSGVIDDPAALDLLRRAALDPQDGASVVACRLSVGDEPAAYEIGFVRGRSFHAYLGAVAEGFAGRSPGKVVMEEAMAWAKAEGLSIYDLLPPADRYKRDWSTGSEPVRDMLAPLTFKGRLYAGPWLGRLRPMARDALHRLPAPLRRAVARAAVLAGVR